MRKTSLLAICGLLSASALATDPLTEATAPTTGDENIEVVLVTGIQPGPGLWKVTSGRHVMWVLGEVSPFARNVRWNSSKFDRLMRNSQELLIDFSGFWGANREEMNAYRKAEKLPKGSSLATLISPERMSCQRRCSPWCACLLVLESWWPRRCLDLACSSTRHSRRPRAATRGRSAAT